MSEAAERINPQAAVVHQMPPATRLRYDNHVVRCDAITDEIGGPEALYAQYLETGKWPLPDPPRAVAEALGHGAGPVLTADMDIHDIAEIWAAMVAG